MTDTNTRPETQTALDKVASHARYCFDQFVSNPHSSILGFKDRHPDIFSQALQDPRYIAYCKEQDRKERATRHKEVEHTLRTGGPYDCHTQYTQGMEEKQPDLLIAAPVDVSEAIAKHFRATR